MNKTGVQKEKITHVRNYDYEIVCGVSGTKFPEEWEIPRENTGFLRNQKFQDCVANVIAQLAEAYWCTEFDVEEHSEGFAYGSLRRETSRSPGMIVSQAMDLWTSIGTLPKKYFDLLAEMPEIKKIVANYPNLYEIAKRYKLSGYTQIKTADKTAKDNQIKDALSKYQRGLVAVAPTSFQGGSHCIMLTGWNDKKGKYKFKNSWGASYGDKGFSEIDKSDISEVYVPLFEPVKLPFADVKESDWFYKSIKNMYFAGMMKGVSDTRFEPNTSMTRAEVATMFDRFAKYIDERFDILNQVNEDKEEFLS